VQRLLEGASIQFHLPPKPVSCSDILSGIGLGVGQGGNEGEGFGPVAGDRHLELYLAQREGLGDLLLLARGHPGRPRRTRPGDQMIPRARQ